MFPLYTKTFGGKTWRDLHSVSPDNNFGKDFKMASLQFYRQSKFKHNLLQKRWVQIHVKIFGQFQRMDPLSCTRLSQIYQSRIYY